VNDLEIVRAFTDLARAVTADSAVTAAPVTTTVRAVIVTVTPSPLTARVGIATTATPVTNTIPGYTPAAGHVVVVARVGRRQYITGKI
jgi:hypothetical protein